jgi:hypothetical protein
MITANTMRSCNFFYADIRVFSGGCTQLGSLRMATGVDQHRARLILTDRKLKRLLMVKTQYGERGLKRILDVIAR